MAIVKAAPRLAAAGEGVYVDVSESFGFRGETSNSVDCTWFAVHAGHELRPRNEYGEVMPDEYFGTCFCGNGHPHLTHGNLPPDSAVAIVSGMTKKHESHIEDDTSSTWSDKFTKADKESAAAEEPAISKTETPARISLADVHPDHVRDALAHVDAHVLLDGMTATHGKDAVHAAVTSHVDDPNYGATAKSWLSRP
jgi:hypothetical protein